jgi:hypothetical protein
MKLRTLLSVPGLALSLLFGATAVAQDVLALSADAIRIHGGADDEGLDV